MNTTPVSRIAIISALFVTLAGAQQENRLPREGRSKATPAWQQFDTNGDGSLSIGEFRAMPRVSRLPEEHQTRLFQRFDKNQDGKLGKSEVFRMRQGRNPDHRPPHRHRRIMELDSDGSGGVSLDELRIGEMFAKMPPERLEALFKRLDTDGDGQITAKDRPEMRRPGPPRGEPGDRRDRGERRERAEAPSPGAWHRRAFAAADTDQSGSLSFDEFRKIPGIAPLDEDTQEARFMRLDANRDQSLSHDEFSKRPAPQPAPRGEDRPRRPAPRNR